MPDRRPDEPEHLLRLLPRKPSGGAHKKRNYWPLGFGIALTIEAVVCVNLPEQNFFSSPSDYIPVHTVLEFVAIVVSAMVFGLGWNLRHQYGNGTSVMLASAFLAVAVIDLIHTLSYYGMPDFVTPSGPEKAINFWLAGRAIAAVGLLSVAILPDRKWPPSACAGALLASVAVTLLTCWLGLYHAAWLPRTFIPGQGLTAAKIGMEYALMTLYLVAALLLLLQSRREKATGKSWLAVASWALCIGESFFTLYADVTDIFNLMGHLYKALAYILIYRALFVEGVQAPYRALFWERAHLAALLKTIPDLVWLKDLEGTYLACNPQFEMFFGAAEADIVGKTDYDFLEKPLADVFRQKDLEVLTTGKPESHEVWITYACDGRRALVETVKTPMRDANGALIGVLGISRDVTDRNDNKKKLEEQTIRLTSINTELERFAYIAAHDLREPVRLVSNYLTLIERSLGDDLPEATRKYFGFAVTGAKRMDRMIRDLLDYSRIGKSDDKFQNISLKNVVEQSLVELSIAVAESMAKVTVAERLPEVRGMDSELTRLFQNLIGNAIKYRHAERSPEIEIGCHEEGVDWIIWVRDNGMGIEAQYREQVFAVFHRLVPKDLYDGTGIGLAVCRRIVEHHGGRIWIEDAPNGGCVFLITFPRSAPAPRN